METKTRTLTSYGNCALVQFEARPESAFSFKPGGPEIKNGGLVISESGGNGVVGKLVAMNSTSSFLLLTDADLLAGAKQNRVLNRSVLLSPFSKTVLDVSCIERGRWHYSTRNFYSSSALADPDLRKSKARSFSLHANHPEGDSRTQQSVWFSIAGKMQEEKFDSATENYSDLLRHKEGKQKPGFPVCEPENGCNGLAVLIDGKIVCIDIFGTEEVFMHYFPKLRDAAFLQAVAGNDDKAMDVHEAYYKVTDLLDRFDITEKTEDKNYSGAGSLFNRDASDFLGFELDCDGHLIHCGMFGK
jgi:hypothetical protein